MTSGIAISGKQFAGKTTTKSMLAAEFREMGYEVHDLSFAAPLKSQVAAILSAEGLELVGDWKVAHRPALQAGGTKLREFDAEVWVNLALAQVRKIATLPGQHVILCDDCRFENEASALQKAGFFVARLDISPSEQTKRGTVKDPTHESETALDSWEGFDVRVLTDETDPTEVCRIVYSDYLMSPNGTVNA